MSRAAAVMSVRQQIEARLRTDVRSGVYAPGEALREERLATQFGVSRSPIRQVLQKLTHEGLLTFRPNRGTVVAQPPTPEVMAALRDCRAKLECIALRQCYHNLDATDFQKCEELLDSLYGACERGNHGEAYHWDNLFHRVFVDKANAAGSMGVYDGIAGATSEFLRVDKNRPVHADFCELYGMHAALYVMFRLGDVDVACEALSQHILGQEFVAAACRRWTEAGKPRTYDGIYDDLANPLRDAVERRRLTELG